MYRSFISGVVASALGLAGVASTGAGRVRCVRPRRCARSPHHGEQAGEERVEETDQHERPSGYAP